MIERKEVDGRMANVQYLDGELQPVDKADADIIKVVWDDGESVWLDAPGSDEEEDDFEEEEKE